jgi:hypothetical protein
LIMASGRVFPQTKNEPRHQRRGGQLRSGSHLKIQIGMRAFSHGLVTRSSLATRRADLKSPDASARAPLNWPVDGAAGISGRRNRPATLRRVVLSKH